MLDLVVGGRHLILESRLSLEEATRRLEREITAPTAKLWRAMEWRAWEKRTQSFIGEFADGRFHMIRLLREERGRIRPWIDGRLSRVADGCRVDVRLKMPASAIVVCLPFMVLGAAIIASVRFLGLPGLAIGLVMALTPIIVSILEARKATEMLGALFESKPSRSVAAAPDVRL